MPLARASLQQFRSYGESDLKLSPSLNVVAGPNASGKTNLLESLYVLAITKSFRAKDNELVKHGSDYFRIATTDDAGEVSLGFQTGVRGIKKVSHDKVKKTLSAHLGRLPVVLFEPDDLLMLSGSPTLRRRYLDQMLCQTDKDFTKALLAYRRVLRQRNSLLSNFDTSRIRDEIFAWDVQLAEAASKIVQARLKLIAYLNERLPDGYKAIAADGQGIELQYQTKLNPDNYADSLMQALVQNLPTDLAAGFTTTGPHRDDLTVSFKGKLVGTVASRGEIRTIILALKLTELTYFEELFNKRPLLLLDDVMSELDHQRQKQLLENIRGYQSLVTTTDADLVLDDDSATNLIETGKIHA